jgi:uncharacterized protein YukE
MADLRVADAAMAAAQQALTAVADRLAHGADAARGWNPDVAGAGVLAEAFRAHDIAASTALADTATALGTLGKNIAAASQSYGQTDTSLGNAAGNMR